MESDKNRPGQRRPKRPLSKSPHILPNNYGTGHDSDQDMTDANQYGTGIQHDSDVHSSADYDVNQNAASLF
jgi:hypothetical protein